MLVFKHIIILPRNAICNFALNLGLWDPAENGKNT